MKSKLCSGLVVLSIAVLSATAVHADELGTVGVEETVSETGEPADPVTALLESEVLRYYRGIGAEPTEAELKSGLRAAFDMVFAKISIEQIALAVDEAIKRHEKGEDVPFELAVPRFVRALAEEEARAVEGDAVDQGIEVAEAPGVLAEAAGEKALRDKKVGTGLMVSAFVAQGLSFGITLATAFDAPGAFYFIWPVQAGSIPFAPLGVRGFALRFGGWSETERLRWTGIGLLEAAAYSVLVGIVGVAAASGAFRGLGEMEIYLVPGMVAHVGAGIAFVIAGLSCVEAARGAKHRQGLSQSRRSVARSFHRGFVLPTIAPRPDGLSLGLAGVF